MSRAHRFASGSDSPEASTARIEADVTLHAALERGALGSPISGWNLPSDPSTAAPVIMELTESETQHHTTMGL